MPTPGNIPVNDALLQGLARLNTLSEKWARGAVSTKELGRALWEPIYKLAAGAQRARHPGAAAIPGRLDCRIAYRRRDGSYLPMVWDVVPGHMILGICPECFFVAPAQVDHWNRSAPAVFEGQFRGAIQQDPAADKKWTCWQYRADDIWVERGRDGGYLVTIGKAIQCPAYTTCGFRVRVEKSVAKWTPKAVVRPGAGRPLTGPLIVVKGDRGERSIDAEFDRAIHAEKVRAKAAIVERTIATADRQRALNDR